MSVAYRNLDDLAVARLRALAGVVTSGARRVYARRVARSLAGLVGLGAGIALFVAALWQAVAHADARGTLTDLLFFGLEGAAVAYAVGRVVGHVLLGRALARAAAVPATGDAARDLAAIETGTPARVVELGASRLETASVALPMMAASFLLPLTLHYAVARLFGWYRTADYDQWILFSVIIVGHAHLALAICCWLFARRARTITAQELVGRGNRDWFVALSAVTLCGAVPGIVLVAIPPVLVFVTGLAFIPAMFLFMRGRIESERAAIAA
jgi:hypothetical protein